MRTADLTKNASLICCESLSLEFPGGVCAVDGVDLVAPAGEITSLVGPSGCGKTTLLRLIAGLETPTSGMVRIDPPVASHQGDVAFVFQQPSLLPWRTALENVTLPLELIGQIDRRQRRQVAEQMLHRVGLKNALQRFPRELSGGMKMRVSIARALVTGPRVLLLDEPFAALDDMLRTQLGELLLELWNGQRFTAVMVTHNIAESIFLSAQIAVMKNGRLIQTLNNPLPRPRTDAIRSSSDFGQIYGRVSDTLRAGP